MRPRSCPPRELGASLAKLLYRAWDPARSSGPPEEFDEALLGVLLRGGAAGLAFHPLRAWDPEQYPVVGRLRQQHRMDLMHARVRERCLAVTVDALRRAGIESVLIKGWAIARLYPDPGMRPYGDLDLCVRDEDFERAVTALGARVGVRAPVDLHRTSDRQGDLQYGELFEHSRLMPLNGVEVRVPSDEQHLRLLALHMLAHGAWRPLWLCDLAVALEGRRADFDWDLCLRGDPRLSQWVLVSLLLADRLLGARLDGVPETHTQLALPRWLPREVLDAWGSERHANMDAPPSAYLLNGGVIAFAQAVRSNWRNGIQASFELRAPANNLPRMPFRIAASLARIPSALRSIAVSRRATSVPNDGPALTDPS